MASKDSKSITDVVVENFEAVVQKVEELFASEPESTVDAVLQDHEGLKNFIDVLKDSHRPMNERRQAYKLFSALLKSHSVAEENVLYANAEKFPIKDLKNEVAEGYVEHHICDDLMARIDRLNDPIEWSAHVNVLAELVEHHVKEEEEELLPLVRKNIPPELDEAMLVQFLDLRQSTQKTVREDNAGVLNALH